MRKMLLLIVGVITCITASAGYITTEQAETIAKGFLCKRLPESKVSLKMAKRQPLPVNNVTLDATAYYVFNIGTGNGFVLVSGSDLAPKVLAYAESGTFQPEKVPANMQSWLDSYAEQIAYLEQTGGKYEAPRLVSNHSAISPLLKSIWGQDWPFYNLCPMDPTTGKRSFTGCVATAMAQVINYYKHPAQTAVEIPSYITETTSVTMPSVGVTTIDWNNMIDNYTSSATTAQQNAVAQLMLLCGQATEMDYTSDGSGADLALGAKALQQYFGYDKTVRILNRETFSTTSWESLIIDELAAGRPIIYGGNSSKSGHAFIVDGYDGNGMFHINWGWNGNADSYFLLSVLNPYNNEGIGASESLDGYSLYQQAIVGIKHSTGEVIPEHFSVFKISNTGSTTYSRSSTSNDFTGISIKTFVQNLTGDTHSFILGLALYNANNEWVSKLYADGYQGTNFGEINYDPENGYSCPFTNVSLGKGLTNGDYYIVPVSLTENSTVWEPCWGGNVHRIKATINNNTLTLSEPSVSLSGTAQIASSAVLGQTVPLTAQIKNNGSDFNDYIYLFENGSLVGGGIFEVSEGATSTFIMNYIPTTTGNNSLTLAYSKDGSPVPFATMNINITENSSSNVDLNYVVSITNATNNIVKESKVNATISITNNGSAYSDYVRLGIYKYDESDEIYHGVDASVLYLTLAAGATTTIDFTFDNLENNQDYLLSFEYAKDGVMIDDYGYATFTTAFGASELTYSMYTDDITVVAGSELTLPIKMKNATQIRGFRYNLYLPAGVSVIKNSKGRIQASLCEERLVEYDEHTLSVTEQDDGSILFVCGSQYEEAFTGNDGEVLSVKLSVEKDMEGGDYPVILKNIKLTEMDMSNYYEIPVCSSTLTVIPFTLGDINGDQRVDLDDYNGLANRIHGNTPEGFIETAGDVDENGLIDVSDYIGIANIIYAGSIYGNNPCISLSTDEASSVSENSAKLNGTASISNVKLPYSMGFFVSTSGTPSSENYTKKVVYSSSKTGEFSNSFSSTASGLAYSTTYYYRSYVQYDGTYYYGETQSFTTTKKTTYAVGDLYPADNPVGVVFYVSNGGKSGKIASLETTYNYWRGAYNWANSLGSGWYLPSKSELQTIASNWSKLSSYIDNGFYWSSTVYSSGAFDNLYWVVTLGQYMGYSNGSTFENSTGSDGWSINQRDALAVKAF